MRHSPRNWKEEYLEECCDGLPEDDRDDSDEGPTEELEETPETLERLATVLSGLLQTLAQPPPEGGDLVPVRQREELGEVEDDR